MPLLCYTQGMWRVTLVLLSIVAMASTVGAVVAYLADVKASMVDGGAVARIPLHATRFTKSATPILEFSLSDLPQ